MHGRAAVIAALVALATAAPAAAFGPGTTTLLDRPSGDGALTASPFTDQQGRLTAATTPDGRYTAFVSGADGLSDTDDNRAIGIWRRDRQTDTTLLVTEIGSFGGFDQIGISDDGNRVVFLSSTRHLPADTDTSADVYVRDINAGTYTLASPAPGEDIMFSPVISGDGTHVAFYTLGALLPADTAPGLFDVYRFALPTSTLELVSRADTAAGAPGNGSSANPDLSYDGDVVVFNTQATNLDLGDSNGATQDVMWRRMSTSDTQTVSTLDGSATEEGNGASLGQSVSADGDKVAFASTATNFVAGDANDSDVFLKRMTADQTILVSRDDGAAGAKFPTPDGTPVISPDGASVAFSTGFFPSAGEVHVRRGLDGGDPQTHLVSRTPGVTADGSNLPYGVTNGGVVTWVTTARNLPALLGGDVDFEHLYLTDVVADTVEPLLRPTGNPDVAFPAPENHADLDDDGARTVSDDGRFVAFTSAADHLSTEDDNRLTNVFVRDTLTGQTILASRASGAGGAAADASAFHAVISGDGRRVAWETLATNLGAPAVPGNVTHVWVRDLDTHETILASRADGAAGAPGSATSFDPALDRDGSRVAFASSATNLGNGDADATADIHVRDTDSNRTLLASRADGADGPKATGVSDDPYLDASGTRVAFDSSATNLADGDTDAQADSHVRDLAAGRTFWASRPDGNGAAQSDGFNGDSTISADGNRVAFFSSSSNLGNGDADGDADVHVRDLAAGKTILASRATGSDGVKANASADDPVISASGTAVAFRSFASNLVAGDTNGIADTFVRRLDTAETALVSAGLAAPGDGQTASVGAPSPNGDGSCVAFEALGAPELLPPGASPDFSHVLLRVLRRECPLPAIQTTIDSAGVSGTTVTLTFSASAAGATFLCRVDGGPFGPCSSGVQFGGLSAGSHTFEVKAVDPAQFEDATPASRAVVVSAPAGGGGGGGAGGGGGGASTPAPPAPVAPLPLPVRPPAAAVPALAAAKVLKLPKACTSRRRLRITLALPRGARIAGIRATVNGKRATSSRKGVTVDLRGLPRGRFTVQVVLRLTDGRSVTTKRTYRTCSPPKKKRRS